MASKKTSQSETDPTSNSPEPKKSLFLRILRQRFFLVALVILLFFVGLFGWQFFHPGKTSQELLSPAKAVAIPGGTTPAPAHAPPLHPAAKEPVAKPPAPETAKEPPPEETPGHVAPPAPLVEPSRPRVEGEAFTRALIKIMNDQVNQRWFGWRPSSILFGKMGLTDNVNNEQIGVLQVARRSVVVLNENLTRFANTEAYNPRVNEAMNYLMVSADKYWFPSAPGKYREAMDDLRLYIRNLRAGRAKFYTRINCLIALLNEYRDLLGNCYNNLSKDTEADGSAVSWTTEDDYFYYSKGVALGIYQMLEALKIDFKAELQKKNSTGMMDNAISALKTASELNPWLVTDGGKDGFIANHRADMSTYIGQAQNVLNTLERQLATN
ncbi:MAG: DUF2333 family protein [Deltaproteobacteria bacterium]|jgi:hypothetical protein